jgi:vacuole morphology and inheritance protein 14
MYNIAKVAKGEILVYFNQVFDALCKVKPVVVAVLTQN